jgi:ABC-type spermidine/putrescine transport system permease subunit I
VSNTRFIGNVVYDFVGVAGNQPLAAAYAMVPVTDHARLPARARRLGAFEAL